jgi:LuxR family transcriptional regulator, maltose regulon positive regulatory protein
MASRPGLDPLRRPLPRWIVARPGLERRLDDVGPGGLGLVVASAGSGKSVLVRQWAAARPEPRFMALALDAHHDDPVALLRDLVATIRGVAPELEAGLADTTVAGGPALGRPVVDALTGALAALAGDVVLVIEDLHVLSNRALLADLGRLLSGLPSSTRAIVTSRRDPPWTLHALRVAGGLVELRGADLAFTADEAGTLLANVSGRALTDSQVRTLVARTDGWVVGLQLAAISLGQSPDVDEFVRTFAGSHRLVAEYLLEEVLDQQEAEVRSFLLQTSVLDWLSVEVCDAVTGAGNARRMLRELDQRSLFLVPLDRSGELFRYHHLFGDLLLYELRTERPEEVAVLHRRAATWLVGHGRGEEAVAHLLAAGDPMAAHEVICAIGHLLYERGEVATVVGWLEAIEAAQPDCPAEVQVSLLAAQVAVDEVGVAADTYRRLVRRPDITLGERTAANALYTILGFRDLPPEAVARAAADVREGLPQLGPGDVVDFFGIGGRDSVQVMAEYGAAGGLFLQGDLAEAEHTLERLVTLPGSAYPVWKVYALGLLALTRAWAGRCTEALSAATAAVAAADVAGIAVHPACLNAHLATASVHLDRAETGLAATSLAGSRPLLARRRASVAYLDLQALLETRLTAVTAGPDAALERLVAGDEPRSEAAALRRARCALQAQLLIGTGRLAEARALVEGHRREDVLAPARIELAVATGDLRTGRRVLDGWAASGDDLQARVRHRLAAFTVLAAESRHDPARRALQEAVALADSDRLRWPFLEVPAALRALRRQADRGSALASDSLWRLATVLHPRLGAQSALPEHLTDRELEVLAYLPGRMKNNEIADELFVSVNTLKTHLRSIYTKLDVAERNEAVARAVELGLL